MAFSLNRAQIIGNLTRDPELKQTPSGVAVASFGVATNLSWTDQSGQKHDRAEFHNIVAWRKLAEICGQWLKKGMKIYIEGRIQTRDWEGEDGVKRYRTEIVAENMIMLDKKGDAVGKYNAASIPNEASASSGREHQNVAPLEQNEIKSQEKAEKKDEEVTLDDLPF